MQALGVDRIVARACDAVVCHVVEEGALELDERGNVIDCPDRMVVIDVVRQPVATDCVPDGRLTLTLEQAERIARVLDDYAQDIQHRHDAEDLVKH